ncbi:MAG TPA: TlpA disulfide reductase family protein [Gaiellaceae bacterium]|jgi:cytochrome c biogenesis protein CcmG, thiol:disulfide interchange protein DsbE
MARLKLAGQVASVGLVAALLALLVWKVVQNDRTNVASSFTKGRVTKPVDFDLKRLNGNGSLQLSSLRGKVVVVNFWASWCDPCKSEAPRFQNAFERYGKQVAFIGVDTADYSADAGRFLDRYGVTYPNVRDPDRSVLGKYGGLPIPRTFVISPKWQVTGYIFGEARAEELDSAIQKALAA